jgi:hypothetical protein
MRGFLALDYSLTYRGTDKMIKSFRTWSEASAFRIKNNLATFIIVNEKGPNMRGYYLAKFDSAGEVVAIVMENGEAITL